MSHQSASGRAREGSTAEAEGEEEGEEEEEGWEEEEEERSLHRWLKINIMMFGRTNPRDSSSTIELQKTYAQEEGAAGAGRIHHRLQSPLKSSQLIWNGGGTYWYEARTYVRQRQLRRAPTA